MPPRGGGGFRGGRSGGGGKFRGGSAGGGKPGFRGRGAGGPKRSAGGGGRSFGAASRGDAGGGESRGSGGFKGGGESRGGFRGGFKGSGESRGGYKGGGESRGGFKSESRGGFKGGGESRGGFRGGGESRGGFKSESRGGPRSSFRGGDDRGGGARGAFRGGTGPRGPRGSDRRAPPAHDFRGGLARGFDEAERDPSLDALPKSSPTRFVFGVNPALEALRARPEEIERLYYAEVSMNPSVAGEILSRARDAQVRVDQVPRERLLSFAEGGVHQGVVLEMREFKYAELDELTKDLGLVVVLDSLQDPMNVGAIIRSANAFGAKGVVLAKDRAAAITGSVVKASAGATEHTKIVRVTNLSRALEELKAAGYWSVAADPAGEPLGTKKLDGPLAVVIGAEGPGVRPGVLTHCDFKVRIPMLGNVASLNASVSAGILLYEIVRQRGAAIES